MKQDGRRVAKFERQVHELVAQYFIRGFKTPHDGLITVSKVLMPGDLRSAKIYLSVFGENINRKDLLEKIQSRAFEFQKHIGVELKARYCPKLTFFWDESIDKVLKVEKTLEELLKKQ
ncbi:MAG TPA: 30S ribosome-binding factor RbfA [Pseudobdellovibrionaceae bacterium]|nr:30S ribosome-binding factor RbfA [Pseudobdellovibrionaceae bacterium]